MVTISLVVPSILSLYKHLHDLAMKDSLVKRYREAFVRAKMDISHKAIQNLPFNDMDYFQARVLDPSFGLKWVDHGVKSGDYKKEEVKRAIRGSVLATNMGDQTVAQNTLSEASHPPPSKARRLFAYQSTSSSPRYQTPSLATDNTT